MVLLNGRVSRLGIYFFYDKDGVVDTFCTYFLEDLLQSLDRLIIVCNGYLTPEGRERFGAYTTEIIVRDNKGLDVWAYKQALEYVGWNECARYDEVVLCNSTSMGPVYPFKSMFREMETRNLDFWGITKTHKVEGFDFGYNPYGYLPEHIQSYFIVYRKSLIQSSELQKYWTNMPEIKSYEQSVGLYESVFTKLFSDKGFKWDVYVNTNDFEGITDQPLMHYPEVLVRERKCPIFKRRTFFHKYHDTLNHTAGQSALMLYEFLFSSQLYDTNMIWENILRCYNLVDVARQLHLNYTLSTRYVDTGAIKDVMKRKKIALFMHLYFDDIFQKSFQLALAVPAEMDIYVTTNTIQKKKKIEQIFSELKCKSLHVNIVKNRGRDMSALLVGMRDKIKEYDLVCFSHDKKSVQSTPGSVGESFAYTCYSNVLYNKVFVENVILLFEENSRLGMAVPPAPIHGEYRGMYGKNWGRNFENTQQLCTGLGVKVPISKDENPIAPYGNVFWFRPSAMKKLFDRVWEYEDFPEEPLEVDETISHAIERVYSFVAQDAGFYSAVIMSDFFERIMYTNLEYFVSNNYYVEELETRLKDVYASTSWKVSKPVRVVGELSKTLKKKEKK